MCIWWDSKGVVYYELHLRNVIVTAKAHYQQLRRLQERRLGRQRRVIIQQDNARPHTVYHNSGYSRARLGYYPDFASSDFSLFRSLWDNLRGISFNTTSCFKISIVNSSLPNHFIIETTVIQTSTFNIFFY